MCVCGIQNKRDTLKHRTGMVMVPTGIEREGERARANVERASLSLLVRILHNVVTAPRICAAQARRVLLCGLRAYL